MSAIGAGEIVVSAGVCGGIAASWIAVIRARARHERALIREHMRTTRASGAAAVAAEDDPVFSPEEIRRSVNDVLAFGQALWRTHHIDGLTDRRDAHPDQRVGTVAGPPWSCSAVSQVLSYRERPRAIAWSRARAAVRRQRVETLRTELLLSERQLIHCGLVYRWEL